MPLFLYKLCMSTVYRLCMWTMRIWTLAVHMRWMCIKITIPNESDILYCQFYTFPVWYHRFPATSVLQQCCRLVLNSCTLGNNTVVQWMWPLEPLALVSWQVGVTARTSGGMTSWTSCLSQLTTQGEQVDITVSCIDVCSKCWEKNKNHYVITTAVVLMCFLCRSYSRTH